MDLQTLIDENKKLEDALKSDESNDSSQESGDTDNEDLSSYSEDPKSSQERNDTDAEDLDYDNEQPQPGGLNGKYRYLVILRASLLYDLIDFRPWL